MTAGAEPHGWRFGRQTALHHRRDVQYVDHRRQAVGFLLITVILWSTSGLLVKLLPWNALAISGARSLITGLVIWIYLRHPHFTWSTPQIGGAIAFVLAQTLFIASTQLTTAANAIFLQYSAPIFVALFGSWYLGERVRMVDWFAMGAIFAGMFLFLLDGLTTGGMLGNALAVLSGISFAWMILFMRKQKDGSPLETALLGSIIAAVIGLPFIAWEIRNGTPLGLQGAAILGFLGVFQLGIPFILYSQAIRALTAVEAVLIQTLEPILNPLWVFLVIDERPGQLAMLGGVIVLVSVAATAVYTARQDRKTPQLAAAD